MVAGMAVALTAVVVTGMGGTAGSGGDYWAHSAAAFEPPRTPAPPAVTYDRALVPVDSSIEVHQHTGASGATTVRLRVTGMQAGHTYGAHVHREPCGAGPDDSGGHYQHSPSDATAENEVWLDFTADAKGVGEAVSKHAWGFRAGEASSLVLHERPGDSGARVGCFTVPFGRDGGTVPTVPTGPGSSEHGWTRLGAGSYPNGWDGSGPGRYAYGWAGPGSGPYTYGWAGPGVASGGWAGPGTVPFTWLRGGQGHGQEHG